MFQKLQSVIACALISSVLFTGCAAILSSSTASVKFDSDPHGAKVYDNGTLLGTTPTEAKITKRKDHAVEFRLAGYESATKMLTSSAGGGWIVLDLLLGGIIGLVVDAASGAWNDLDNDYVKVLLEPKSGN